MISCGDSPTGVLIPPFLSKVQAWSWLSGTKSPQIINGRLQPAVKAVPGTTVVSVSGLVGMSLGHLGHHLEPDGLDLKAWIYVGYVTSGVPKVG